MNYVITFEKTNMFRPNTFKAFSSQSAIFFDQNDSWVAIIEGKKRVENFRCGQPWRPK